jgi:hypothetical protein
MMLDNSLPTSGYLKVVFPTSTFIPVATATATPNNCNAWDLTGAASLAYPGDTATTLIKGVVAGTAPTFYCTWSVALAAGTAYGVHFDAAG